MVQINVGYAVAGRLKMRLSQMRPLVRLGGGSDAISTVDRERRHRESRVRYTRKSFGRKFYDVESALNNCVN